jgi:hypothetical protein
MRMRLTQSLMFALAVTVAVPLSAQFGDRRVGGAGILVYEDQNYRGRNATFLDDTPNLSGTGLERRITSLRVAPGEMWEVCTERSYRGRCQVFSGSESDLRELGWSDTIASLRRVRGNQGRGNTPRGALELFAGTRYSGQRVVIGEAVDNLREYNFNDRAVSIRIPRGESWEVCVNVNFDDCLVIDENLPDLTQISMQRNISSVRPHVYDGRGGGQVGRGRFGDRGRSDNGNLNRIVLYEQPNFRGRSQVIDRDLASLVFFNNDAGSIAVEGGRWELCDQPRYGGRCVTITEDVPDLRRLRLNNQVSSVRVR